MRPRGNEFSRVAIFALLALLAFWNLTQSARAEEERWWGEIMAQSRCDPD
jgi:hypothetical protein